MDPRTTASFRFGQQPQASQPQFSTPVNMMPHYMWPQPGMQQCLQPGIHQSMPQQMPMPLPPPFIPMVPSPAEIDIEAEKRRTAIEREKLRNRKNAAEQRRKQKAATSSRKQEIANLREQVSSMASEIACFKARLETYEAEEKEKKQTVGEEAGSDANLLDEVSS